MRQAPCNDSERPLSGSIIFLTNQPFYVTFLIDVIINTLEKYMHYIEFQKELGPFTVFSLADIRQVDSAFDRRRLNEMAG